MIDKLGFETKIRQHHEHFELDYDFADGLNVFKGDIEDMTIRIFETGKATVEYHGVVRRANGNFETLYTELLETKEQLMRIAFGEMEAVQDNYED